MDDLCTSCVSVTHSEVQGMCDVLYRVVELVGPESNSEPEPIRVWDLYVDAFTYHMESPRITCLLTLSNKFSTWSLELDMNQRRMQK